MMLTLQERLDMTHAYCCAIRNADKRAYALAYRTMLIEERGGFETREPERPAKLSYMAAQAVRLRLHDMLNG